MVGIPLKNTFAVKKGAAKKLQVPVTKSRTMEKDFIKVNLN